MAQYPGGDGDGAVKSSLSGITLNNQAAYCSAGDDDGFDHNLFEGTAYNPSVAFEGGEEDGSNAASKVAGPVNEQSFYCSSDMHDGFGFAAFSGFGYPDEIPFAGGNGDGLAWLNKNTTLNNQGYYCRGSDDEGSSFDSFGGYAFNPLAFNGGGSDGFSFLNHSSYLYEANLFAGGVGDGGHLASLNDQYLGFGIWTGLSNTDWENMSNWKYGVLPVSTSTVTIPDDCPFYPLLNGSLSINSYSADYFIYRLDILPGGVFNSGDQVLVGGELNIWGDLGIDANMDQLVKITNGGKLEVDSAGSLLIGMQTTGPALADLMILNNGLLSLKNGIIEIDDQLNIYWGGRLEMHDGILFAHKYGEGSPMGSSGSMSPFYMNYGVQGFINGGSVRVVGKTSESEVAAVQINDPSFVFGDNSLIVVRYGNSADHQDCEIKTAPGVSLGKIRVNDDKKLVVKSDLHVKTSLIVNPGAELEIESGNALYLGN